MHLCLNSNQQHDTHISDGIISLSFVNYILFYSEIVLIGKSAGADSGLTVTGIKAYNNNTCKLRIKN